MARGKKQHAKGTKGKSAGYSKDDLSVTSIHKQEEPLSSTQFCQKPNPGAGEHKYVPTFSSRKRNVQFSSNLELSIPKSKVVPRFGKKTEKDCSSDNGIEDSNDPPCSTKDLPSESDEESSNKSFPSTSPTLEQGLKDEPQKLQPGGTCTATQVQNSPGNILQDTPLTDVSECLILSIYIECSGTHYLKTNSVIGSPPVIPGNPVLYYSVQFQLQN